MLRRELIEIIKKSVSDWAKQYPHVELSLVEVHPSGIGDDLHVIVVAKNGFDNWRKLERQDDIFSFLNHQLGDAVVAKISALYAFTEEQYEKYEMAHNETSIY